MATETEIEAVSRALSARDGWGPKRNGPERQRYRDAAEVAIAVLDRVRADDARDALAELVRLKDHPEHDTLSPIVKREAWQRAREALAGGRTPPNDK